MAAFFLFQDQETLERRTWVLLGAVLTAVSGLGTVLLLLLRKCSPELLHRGCHMDVNVHRYSQYLLLSSGNV